MTVATIAASSALPSSKLSTALEVAEDYGMGANAHSDEEIVLEKVDLEGPYSRPLGETEHNWCRAVGSGTGISVLAMLFCHSVPPSALQMAVNRLMIKHPRLCSRLRWSEGRPGFQMCEDAHVTVEVVDVSTEAVEGGSAEKQKEVGNQEQPSTGEMQDEEEYEWMAHVEAELNTNVWPEKQDGSLSEKLFVVRLYLLPAQRSLMIIRLHTAVCDRVSAATVMVDILQSLRDGPPPSDQKDPTDPGHSIDEDCSVSGGDLHLMSVEEAIPLGQAEKPFWAHGIDLLGYSLGSRRHALIPFDEPNEPRKSKIIHSVLSVEHTQQLLQMCQKANTTLYGALCAAGLKAAAALKQLCRRSEHFALVTLVDCRDYLNPNLSESSVGFYHSALLNTYHVNEMTDFWEVANRCSRTLDQSMRNRKHLTDMGDLNFLMCQAIQHPALTPSSSMRTSLLVLFRDPILVQMEDLAQEVGVERYLGCSSIHGVGPSLAIFESVRKGALHFTGVYPSPLYSRAQMRTYVKLMLDTIIQSLQN